MGDEERGCSGGVHGVFLACSFTEKGPAEAEPMGPGRGGLLAGDEVKSNHAKGQVIAEGAECAEVVDSLFVSVVVGGKEAANSGEEVAVVGQKNAALDPVWGVVGENGDSVGHGVLRGG